MHGRKYRNAARTCTVVFANSTYTADDFAAQVREATDGRGVDVVLEHVGGRVFEQSLSAVEPYQHDPMLPPEFFDMRHAGRSGESQED